MKIFKVLADYTEGLMHLVYPMICQDCGTALVIGEEVLCIVCQHSLPHTMFSRIQNNPAEKIFWGRQPVERATSVFYYYKGNSIQRMLHKVKYKGKRKLGHKLGKIFANQLKEANFFRGIDMIVPVPLHRSKLRKRGFNQCVIFAEELSALSGIPYSDKILYRVEAGLSQTRKSRFERWQNTERMFDVMNDNEIFQKNVLLIDDVITTGSTLEACIQTILKKTDVKISIATFAYSD